MRNPSDDGSAARFTADISRTVSRERVRITPGGHIRVCVDALLSVDETSGLRDELDQAIEALQSTHTPTTRRHA
jgi:hypothetical protein